MAAFYNVTIASVEGARVVIELAYYDPQVARISTSHGRPGGYRFALEILLEANDRAPSPLSRAWDSRYQKRPTDFVQSVHLTRTESDPEVTASFPDILAPGDETDWELVVRVCDPEWAAHLRPGDHWLSTQTPTVGGWGDDWADRNDTTVGEQEETLARVTRLGGWTTLPPLLKTMWEDIFQGNFSPLVPYAMMSWKHVPALNEHADFLPDAWTRNKLARLGIHLFGTGCEYDGLLGVWQPTPQAPLVECPVLCLNEECAYRVVGDGLDQYVEAAHAKNIAALREQGRHGEAAQLERDLAAWLQEHGRPDRPTAFSPARQQPLTDHILANLLDDETEQSALIWMGVFLMDKNTRTGTERCLAPRQLAPLLPIAIQHLRRREQERYHAAIFFNDALQEEELRELVDVDALLAACGELFGAVSADTPKEEMARLEGDSLEILCSVLLAILSDASLAILLHTIAHGPPWLYQAILRDDYGWLEQYLEEAPIPAPLRDRLVRLFVALLSDPRRALDANALRWRLGEAGLLQQELTEQGAHGGVAQLSAVLAG